MNAVGRVAVEWIRIVRLLRGCAISEWSGRSPAGVPVRERRGRRPGKSWPLTTVAAVTCVLAAFGAAARPAPESPVDYEARQRSWEKHQSMQRDSLFHGLTWRDVGPVVQGGRVVDIDVVPGAPYSFYVAYASGGLWRTDNNGVTFRPLFDQQATLIMGDIATDPNAPERLWVGTGEPNSSRSSYGGLGVYRTDDGGESWQHMGLGDTDRIGRILVDPNDSQRVYVAALGRLYTAGGARGVFRTTDGGESWQSVLSADRENTGAIDLVMDPRDSRVLYAATWERSRRPWNFVEGGPGSGVWKSTDGGDTWRQLGDGLPSGEHVGRIGLAIAPARPDTIYAAIDNQTPLPESQWDLGDRPLSAKRLRGMDKAEFLHQDPEEVEAFIRSSDLDTELDAEELLRRVREDEISVDDLRKELDDANASLFDADIRGIEVYRSDDGGESWRLTHDEPIRDVVFTYGYYFGQIRVAPDDADRIYVLGVPLIQSDDGGATWRSIDGPDVHVDHHFLWADPANPQRLVLGNDGGIDTSFDGGKTWVKLDAQPVGQFYTIAVDMAEPYNVYGGLQDNGTLKGSSKTRWRHGDRWEVINGGDGMYVAVDPRDNQTVYSGFQFGFYSRDGDDERRAVRPRDRIGEAALRYNWNTPVVLSTHNPDIVYFGASRLYRSMNQGETWTAISDELARARQRGDVPFGTITTVSESPLAFGLLWAGTDDGEVRVSPDGGNTWKDVASALPKSRWVSRVEASAHDRDRAYVALNGYRDDDTAAYVYRTDDLGRRWRDIAGGLPAEAVNVVREDPINDDVVYVGTDRGVYVSHDRGDSWQSLQTGLPNAPVHDLVVHPRERELVAGTHGRSAWIVDVLSLQDLTNEVREKSLHAFYADPVQASSRWWRRRPSLWFDREWDKPEATFHYWSDDAGAIEWRIENNDGDVLYRDEQEARRGINRIRWDLLVDESLALAAEKRTSPADDDETHSTLADQPYAESVRLGHRLYIEPGDYRLQLERAGATASVEFTVDPVESPKPRRKPEPPIRGFDETGE